MVAYNREQIRQMRAGFEQFRSDLDFLDKHKAELLSKYPRQWVGVRKGEIFLAPTLDELVKKIGNGSPRPAVAHLEPNPKALILPQRQYPAPYVSTSRTDLQRSR